MLRVEPYTDADAEAWDELVARAPMGTFLHTRRFLSYHGDRFRDASLVVRDEKGRLEAVLPAAADPAQAGRVTSHPGATYGGLVHDGSLLGGRVIEALEAVAAHYAEAGFATFRYKAVPVIYHRAPCADDLYALFRLGAFRARCDLSCAIDVANRRKPASRRRRGLRKAERAGVELAEGPALASELWPVLEENLARRHGARPVHTLEEIRLLIDRFPEEIAIVGARIGDRLVAGVVLFRAPTVLHAQYIASTPEGNEASALDAVFESCIERAGREGCRYFDFGISNTDEGRELNEGLYRFKAEFGGGGAVHEFYDVALGPSAGSATATPNPVRP